ncbi:hypothetical protein OE749_01250 [Aestuariibacter sp. AA17]|uniref:DUF2974 domain-containing protein n=1 Tax=Fluctibacter corallii TaxID=2984329 RepID=A0ABT3A4L2_9ALTE|nr:hypothetical protein [Aestuariibacter sp. AA17]MCV2883321.1 hypothetical protein [Aestuariibacter sp. AA17]
MSNPKQLIRATSRLMRGKPHAPFSYIQQEGRPLGLDARISESRPYQGEGGYSQNHDGNRNHNSGGGEGSGGSGENQKGNGWRTARRLFGRGLAVGAVGVGLKDQYERFKISEFQQPEVISRTHMTPEERLSTFASNAAYSIDGDLSKSEDYKKLRDEGYHPPSEDALKQLANEPGIERVDFETGAVYGSRGERWFALVKDEPDGIKVISSVRGSLAEISRDAAWDWGSVNIPSMFNIKVGDQTNNLTNHTEALLGSLIDESGGKKISWLSTGHSKGGQQASVIATNLQIGFGDLVDARSISLQSASVSHTEINNLAHKFNMPSDKVLAVQQSIGTLIRGKNEPLSSIFMRNLFHQPAAGGVIYEFPETEEQREKSLVLDTRVKKMRDLFMQSLKELPVDEADRHEDSFLSMLTAYVLSQLSYHSLEALSALAESQHVR